MKKEIIKINNLSYKVKDGDEEKMLLNNISISFEMPEIITISGPSGSGKTTFGKTLAAGLSYHFIDTDDVIIQTYHKPLMELIDEYGTEGFITLEGKVLQSIYTNQAVISTGGSAVYSDDAMQYLKSTGIVIYLHHQLDVLAQRVGNLVTRGVVCHSGCTTLEDLYEERCPLYEKYADLTVDFTGCSVEQCSEKLLKTVQAYLKEHPNC